MRLKAFREDLPVPARLYVLLVLSVGLPVFTYCLIRALERDPPQWLLLVLVSAAVTRLETVRIRLVLREVTDSTHSYYFSPSDLLVLSGFIFFSPEVGAVVSGADGLFLSLPKVSRPRRYRVWFNLASLSLIGWSVGKFFYWTQGQEAPLNPDAVADPLWLVLGLYMAVVVHIALNLSLNGLAIGLSSGRPFLDHIKSQVWFLFPGLVGAVGAALVLFFLSGHYRLSWLVAVPLVLVAHGANQAMGWRVNTLLESRELLQDSLDALTAYVAVLNENGRILTVNQAWRESLAPDRLFGAGIGEGIDYHQASRRLAASIGDTEMVLHAVRQVGDGERAQCRLDYNCAPAAPDAWFQLGVSCFQSSHGRRLIVAHQEITDLKLSERRAWESERNYRRFFEEDLAGAFVADGDGVLTDCNPAFARILGFGAPEEAVGASLLRLFPEESEARGLIERLRREKLEYVETELLTMEGAQVNVVANLTGRISEGGRLQEIRGYLFDDTRRKKLEAEVMQARKMDAVGQLAGGIAHEFNNILTVVMGCAEFLKGSLDGHAELAAEAALVLNAAGQGSRLTRQFQLFSKGEAQPGEVVVLDQLVKQMEPTLRKVAGDRIHLKTRLEAGEARLLADAAQIEQVILNLVVNARDAMPEGGELRLETLLSVSSDLPIRLRVTDTGTGMSEEVRMRVFEPFFTTKPRGSGTGLGLATVYGILRQSGGRIEVESELGKGSSFELFFPLGDSLQKTERLEASVAASLRGGETILLVEDQEQIRQLLGRTLRRNGYRVLAASNGIEALSLAERHEGPIHLLVTDVIMPRMSGWELADRIRTKKTPRPQVLFVTGYANRGGGLDKGVDWPTVNRLDKPFTPETLLRRVRALLDAGRPPG